MEKVGEQRTNGSAMGPLRSKICEEGQCEVSACPQKTTYKKRKVNGRALPSPPPIAFSKKTEKRTQDDGYPLLTKL
jgi:hypothetical protein